MWDVCCRYVDDAGDLDAPAGMSYAEWEAQRGEVQIPKWMEKILRIPGGAFCLLLILLPLTLVRTRTPCQRDSLYERVCALPWRCLMTLDFLWVPWILPPISVPFRFYAAAYLG